MKIYVGIDIGTTNSKAVALSSEGRVLEVLKRDTPKKSINGVSFFDIGGIENIADGFVEELSKRYEVSGVGFSSVGESVVPVSEGRAVHDPLVWYESCTTVSCEEQRIIGERTDYLTTGIEPYIRLSLYKILWMLRNLDLPRVEYWLPISSYLSYRKTGEAVWDTSQACRSFMIDVHNRRWNEGLLRDLGIPGALGGLAFMGERLGVKDGIVYGLGGHDHIAGLFAVYNFRNRGSLIYDSMGTASVITALAEERERELHLEAPEGVAGGAVGAAFKPGQYYLLKPFRYFGLFISRLMELTGRDVGAEAFRSINNRIAGLSAVRPKAYFAVGGDALLGNSRERMSILNMEMDTDDCELVQSGYVYLGMISKIMLEDLNNHCGDATPYFAGGAVTKDEVFMTYKASILGREILVLDTDEISALGAALAAAGAAGDEALLSSFSSSSLVRRSFVPDRRISSGLSGVYEEYRRIMEYGSSDLFQ